MMSHNNKNKGMVFFGLCPSQRERENFFLNHVQMGNIDAIKQCLESGKFSGATADADTGPPGFLGQCQSTSAEFLTGFYAIIYLTQVIRPCI